VTPVAEIERSSKLKVQSFRKVPNYKLQSRPAPPLRSRWKAVWTDGTAVAMASCGLGLGILQLFLSFEL